MGGLAAMSVVPVLGWAVSAVLAFLIAIPVHFLWHWLGPIYFPFVPTLYLGIGFWDTVGMLVLVGFAKLIIFPSAMNVGASPK